MARLAPELKLMRIEVGVGLIVMPGGTGTTVTSPRLTREQVKFELRAIKGEAYQPPHDYDPNRIRALNDTFTPEAA